jgi:hypothetical protein
MFIFLVDVNATVLLIKELLFEKAYIFYISEVRVVNLGVSKALEFD